MLSSTLFSRLRIVAVLLALGAWGWRGVDGPTTDLLTWEQTAHDSFGTPGDKPVETARRAWLDGGVNRQRLAQTIGATPIGFNAFFDVPELTSVADTGDQGDGLAFVEARGRSGVQPHSGVIRSGSSASPDSRTRSSASPRAPPPSLRLA